MRARDSGLRRMEQRWDLFGELGTVVQRASFNQVGVVIEVLWRFGSGPPVAVDVHEAIEISRSIE